MLQDRNSEVRIGAIEALANIHTAEEIPIVVNLLREDNEVVRTKAADTLQKIFSTVRDIKRLLPLFQDEDIEVRRTAAEIFEMMGTIDHFPFLEPLIYDENSSVRHAAVRALAKIAVPDHIPLLKQLFNDDNKYIRVIAVETVGIIGSSKDFPSLEPMIKHEDDYVRSSAAEAIGKIGTIGNIGILKPLLKDYDKWVRRAATDAIENIWKRSQPVFPKIQLERKGIKDITVHRSFLSAIPPLHILHISDIHYNEKNNDSINEIFEKFSKDISKWRKQHSNDPIQVICITGDIAFSGQKEQYGLIHEKINEIIKTSGCSKDNLFIIPGNHDVHEYANFPEICRQIMDQAVRDNIKIDHILGDWEQYRHFHDKFNNYYDYMKASDFTSSLPEIRNEIPKPWYSRRLKDFPVRIIGLNSALFCLEPYCKRDKICMGICQFEEAYPPNFKDAREQELIIMLTHHPADWLLGNEKDNYEKFMNKHHVVHLYGHTHEPKAYSVCTYSGNNYLLIGTGSIYGENGTKDINTYYILTLDFEKQNIHIHDRRWEPARREWSVSSGNKRPDFPFPGEYFTK
ncbi:MAG TPA: HEAT repeat domain-containing protein [Candidatus Deferrimicrobium sp.]|nr:HEAT repeat domain-containing protein [Candidatus Deferrimicrobium sp.]